MKLCAKSIGQKQHIFGRSQKQTLYFVFMFLLFGLGSVVLCITFYDKIRWLKGSFFIPGIDCLPDYVKRAPIRLLQRPFIAVFQRNTYRTPNNLSDHCLLIVNNLPTKKCECIFLCLATIFIIYVRLKRKSYAQEDILARYNFCNHIAMKIM